MKKTQQPPTDESTHPTFVLQVRPKPGKARRCHPMLLCVEGPHRGDRFALNASETYIGRSSTAGIPLKDNMASRRHAKITYHNHERPEEPPECYLEDLGSRNGTELNGRIIPLPARLHERDRILVGSSLFGFFLRDDHEMEHEQLLYEMATRDALTGLDNRHQFRTHLVQHVERSRRYGRTLTLLIIDIDHFKKINDTYGHDVGDRALIHLSRLLEASCRQSEIVARWGGEEFVILLPESGDETPAAVGERIRQVVEANPLQHDKDVIGMTVSIGGAVLRTEDDADSFFRRADQQLYLAKEDGRNRVILEAV